MIKELIRTVPDYPKKDVMFRDITTLIKDPVGFRLVIDEFTRRYIKGDIQFDTVVGIESRGFIIGGALSYALGKGFIPIRKKGKLPAKTVQQEYELEYGTDIIEMHEDSLTEGTRVLLIDDLLATGGTAEATVALLGNFDATIAGIDFLIELVDLGGRKKLKGQDVFAAIKY